MNTELELEALILSILLVAALVGMIGRRFHFPYTVALVLAGLALSFRSPLAIEFPPEIFLTLLLPPLVFEASLHLELRELRRNLGMIILLAVPGVVINMLLVGGVLAFGAGFSIATALVFGALTAAVDPVAVISIFRRLGVPRRLEVLLEGESLLNDATAIVVFGLVLNTAATGQFELTSSVIEFVRVAGGGVIVGLILGWLTSRLIAQIDDHLIETTLTTVLAFGVFIAAEAFHLSGVLAVVTAGIVAGNVGPRGMSPTTRIVLFNFWEYGAFLANSAVFLLLGLRTDIPVLVEHLGPVLWAIAAVLISRAAVIYLFTRLGRSMPSSWRHVLFWGGLRGAIALALALTIPASFGPERETLIAMAFGVVLFSIIVQGLSMDRLLQRLGVVRQSEGQLEYERRRARAMALQAGYDYLRELRSQGLISAHTWETLQPVLRERINVLTTAVKDVLHEIPELETNELKTARQEMLRAQRDALGSMRRSGLISEIVYEQMVTELDTALEQEYADWTGQAHAGEEGEETICQLIIAVVQAQDLESATNALSMRGIRVTQVMSKGGYLGRRNHTLLIGIPAGKLESAVEALERTCKTRVEYLPSPFVEAPFPPADAMAIQVSGATVFVFDVERCEVI